MDITKFTYPHHTTHDIESFSKTIPELLLEAVLRGFYKGNTYYNWLADVLVPNGGQMKFKKGIDEDFRRYAWYYVRAHLKSSTDPDNKNAVCALILSELFIEHDYFTLDISFKETQTDL